MGAGLWAVMFELTIAMILWGTLGVFVLWSHLPAIDIAFYRCLIGSVFMGLWLLKNQEKIKLNKNTLIVAIAGICLVLNWVFLFKSFQISSMTIGNISYYLQPIMLLILGIFLYKEKVSFQKWLLILLAMVGVLLTIDLQNLKSSNILVGVAFALIAALLYSFVTVFMKRASMSYFSAIFIQLTIGTFILLPFVHFQTLMVSSMLCLFIIGTIHTLFAYFLYYKAIKKTNFTQIAIFSYLDPIVAILCDVVFFNQKLNVYQIGGIGITFLALYLLVSPSKKNKLVAST